MKNIINKFYYIGLIVAVVIALALVAEFQLFSNKYSEITQSLAASERDTTVSRINNELLGQAQTINSIAHYISIENWDRAMLLKYMIKLMKSNPNFSSIYFGSPDNVMINGSGWIPPKEFDLRVRPWYTKAVAEKKLIFTEAFVNASKDKLIITIAEPVYSAKGQLLGVVAGDISIKEIVSIIKNKDKEEGYSFVIDGKGKILAHPDFEYGVTSPVKNISEISEDLYTELLQNNSGTTEISIAGTDGYLSYKYVKKTDWIVAYFTPLDKYSKKDTQFLRIFFISLIVSLMVFTIFILQQKRSFITPMLKLGEDIQKINIEADKSYRLSTNKNDHFLSLRQCINTVLNRTEELFGQLQEEHNRIISIEEKQKAMISNISEIIGIIDETGIVKYVSPNVQKWFGWHPDEITNAYWDKIVHPEDIEFLQKEFVNILQEEGSIKTVQFRYKCKDERYKIVEMRGINLINDSNIKGVLVNHKDISQQKITEEELVTAKLEAEKLATTDYLTGILNRRAFVDRFNEEFYRTGREKSSISLIMTDIDHFKKINDTYGHQAGDYALQKFVKCILSVCRPYDFFGRLGGEEFMICLPNTNITHAEKIAERMRKAVEELTIKLVYLENPIKITASFGVASPILGNEENIDTLIMQADKAMYRAKVSGRNRVCTVSDNFS